LYCSRIKPNGLIRLDGLHMRIVTASILSKQLRTADKAWSSSMGVGRGANNSWH